jgi:hypothetical protein
MESKNINEALGLTNEWRILTDARIEELFNSEETISDVMESEALTAKAQEFGEGSYELTAYEKKLVLSGFMIAQEMYTRKMRAAAAEAMMGLLADRMGMDPSKLNTEKGEE